MDVKTETINKLETMIEFLVKSEAAPEYIIEMVTKLYNYENVDYTPEEISGRVYSSLESSKRDSYDGRLNIKAAVMDLVASVAGSTLSLQFCYNSLQLTTAKEKSACRMALTRLCRMGWIEPVGTQAGLYRKVARQAEKIDFVNASGDMLDLKWPFQIERLCGIMPKNIVVITGSPDTGKTAFLLDFIRRNMNKHNIHYFSSEMGALELQSRLLKFPQLKLEDWKFNPVERSNNFSDVIQPDDVNVIDFLEVHQDFYLVGQWIKDIFDKLNKGIAVIAIQKNTGKGQDIARGGVGSLEKPRLYISLSNNPHILKIVKAKNWINDLVNPNGLFMRYKIVGGCQFKKERMPNGDECDWEKESPEETQTALGRRF